jgi:chromosome segregation ATPase
MSFSICRIAKIKSSGVTGIQLHDRREKGISHTNEDIDWNKTHENINLLEQQEKFRTVVKNRIEELNLNRAVRKDATVMVQCLITSDSTFFDKMNKDQQVEFFKKSYDFIKDRYGKKNMVSATIHFDERTPHMHVNFVPVTKDNRLSARDLFSPKQLRELQDDFNKYINDKGYDLERGKLDSKKKHLNVQEYKLETKFEELKNRESELDKKIKDLESERDTLKNDLNALKNDLKASKRELGMIDIAKDEIKKLEQIVAKEKLFKKDYVEIKKDTFEQFKNMAKNYRKDTTAIKKTNINLQRKVKNLEKEIDRLIEEKKENIKKVDLAELKEKTDTRNKIISLEKRVEKLSNFIINEGLAEKFNESMEKEIQRNRKIDRGFSR